MFNKAKDFVIQNSVFIDVGNANFYKKKLFMKPSSDTIDSEILSNYRRFKTGDINVVDGQLEDRDHRNLVVEISGESKRRAARVYEGRNGYTRLKSDIGLLAKIWPHPNFQQVYGIFQLKNTVGLVYHQDGTLRKVEDVVQSMAPLQRSICYITYLADYMKTYEYLTERIGLQVFSPSTPTGEIFWELKSNTLNISNSDTSFKFYVDSTDKLCASLSDRHPNSTKSYLYNPGNMEFPRDNIPRDYLEALREIHRTDYIGTPKGKQLISIFYVAILSVMTFLGYDITDDEYFLGLPLLAISGNFKLLYIPGAPMVVLHSTNPRVIWKLNEDIDLTEQASRMENGYTRLELTHLLAKNDIVLVTKLIDIVDEEYYNRWLFIAPHLLQDFAIVRKFKDCRIGIGSGVELRITIETFSSAFIRYLDSNPTAKIYMFISDSMDRISGLVSKPEIYVSLDKTGAERLTEYSARLMGFSSYPPRIALSPKIADLEGFYYEGLADLYRMCGVTKPKSDVSLIESHGIKQRGKEQLPNSIFCVEDIHVSYLSTDCERRWTEMENRVSSSVTARTTIELETFLFNARRMKQWRTYIQNHFSRDTSSLSWIGITFLEDLFGIAGTVYDRVEVQIAREEKQDREEYIKEQEWSYIRAVDCDDLGSDFEEIAYIAPTSDD